MYKLNESGVQRLADGAWIPQVQTNKDWQDYQSLVADGYTAEAADPQADPPVQQPSPQQLVSDLTDQLVKEGRLAKVPDSIQEFKAQAEQL